jgi:hypothetical protein
LFNLQKNLDYFIFICGQGFIFYGRNVMGFLYYVLWMYLLIGLGWGLNTFFSIKPVTVTIANVFASILSLLFWPVVIYLKNTGKSIGGIS